MEEEVKPKDPSKDSILQLLEIGDKDFLKFFDNAIELFQLENE